MLRDDAAYCIEGCGRPATHRRLLGMMGDTPVTELVCGEHADDPFAQPMESDSDAA